MIHVLAVSIGSRDYDAEREETQTAQKVSILAVPAVAVRQVHTESISRMFILLSMLSFSSKQSVFFLKIK